MATTKYVVIGTSPFAETTVAVGPVRATSGAIERLEHLGYVTEVCELISVFHIEERIGTVTNDEGD